MRKSKSHSLTSLHSNLEPDHMLHPGDASRPDIYTPVELMSHRECGVQEKRDMASDISQEEPEVRMSRTVYKEILMSVGSQPPETGGILLGPTDSSEITGFFFDQGGNCTGASYTPDIITLRRKMKEDWIPSGIDMKGFVHSHPWRLDQLTKGDLNYIARLLQKNEDMDVFVAPIVIPSEYRMRPIVVLRENPEVPQEAKLVLF